MRSKRKIFSLVLVALILIAMFVVPVSAKAPTVIAASPGESVVIQADTQAAGDAAQFPIDEMLKGVTNIALFCLGFTAVLKYKFGVKGNWLTASCLVFGFALGIGYWIAMKPPTTYAEWYFGGLFGFLTALATSGVYDIFNNKIIDSAG